LENAQLMAAHESPRTTKLYDPHRRRNHARRSGAHYNLGEKFESPLMSSVLHVTLQHRKVFILWLLRNDETLTLFATSRSVIARLDRRKLE
jgi:hypothetical protein